MSPDPRPTTLAVGAGRVKEPLGHARGHCDGCALGYDVRRRHCIRMLERFKRITARIAATVTRVLLAVGLVLIYVFGIGLTAVAMAVFARRRFAGYRSHAHGYWLEAQGCAPTLEDAKRQS